MNPRKRRRSRSFFVNIFLGAGMLVMPVLVRAIIRRSAPTPRSAVAHDSSVPPVTIKEVSAPSASADFSEPPQNKREARTNEGTSWPTVLRKELEWFVLLFVAVAIGAYAFMHIPASPPALGSSVIEPPAISVNEPDVQSNLSWEGGSDGNYLSLNINFGTTRKHPLVRWAVLIPSDFPIKITKGWSGGGSLQSAERIGLPAYGVDKIQTPKSCKTGRRCDNLILGWSYLTNATAPPSGSAAPDPASEDYLGFDVTWSVNLPTWKVQEEYLSVALPGTIAGGYGIETSDPAQGPIVYEETGGFGQGFDTPAHLPWKPYLPASINVSSYYVTDQLSQPQFNLDSLNDYQIITGVPPQQSTSAWAWVTQGLNSAAAVGQDPFAAQHSEGLLFWIGIALGVAGAAFVAAIQVFTKLRIERQYQRIIDPVAVFSAVVVASTAALYVWFAERQVWTSPDSYLSFSSAALTMLLCTVFIGMYGAFWKAWFRRTALGVAATIALGDAAMFDNVLYFSIPMFIACALYIVSALRRKPRDEG